jgi:hypothetical protein
MINLIQLLREVQQQDYRIYCDLDGVLSDFHGRFRELIGKSPDNFQAEYGKKAFWKAIDDAGEEFWSGMEPMPDAKILWNHISKYKPELLSAPSSKTYSHVGKQLWVNQHLPGTILNLKPATEKHHFCTGPYDILIDDRVDTIERWNNAGGVGVLHKNANDTINQLAKLGL